MCGRLYNTLSAQQVSEVYGKSKTCGCGYKNAPQITGSDKCYKSYNAAPTRYMPIIYAPLKEEKSRKSNKSVKSGRTSKNEKVIPEKEEEKEIGCS